MLSAPMMDVKVHMMSIPVNMNMMPGMGQGQGPGFGPPPSFDPESFKVSQQEVDEKIRNEMDGVIRKNTETRIR